MQQNYGSRAMTERLTVVVRVTERCSLSCRFCGYSRSLGGPRRSIDAAALVRFGRVLAEFHRTHKTVLVSWLGGEPLEWPDLPAVAEEFHRGLGLDQSITTNGFGLRSPRVRRMLIDRFREVTVSLDGLADFHDAVRETPGLFRALEQNVALLRSEDPAGKLLRRVNTVLMRGNIGSFEEFCDDMAAWGFRELTFNQLGGRDRPEFFPANRLLPEQVDRFRRDLPAMRERMAQCGMTLCGSDEYLDRIAMTTAGVAMPVDDCRPGESFLFLDEQGRASPCSYTSGCYGIPIEEIDSCDALAALAERFAHQRRQHRAPICDDCPATHVVRKFAT